MRGTVDNDADAAARLTTLKDGVAVGDIGSVPSRARLMETVFSGFSSLTTLVTTTVLIDAGMLLASAVTVLMLSEVWTRLKISVTEAADIVASEPPSTATTEYATRLRTRGCLEYVWGFSGKAWEARFKEQSTNTRRRDLGHMIKTDGMRGY